MHDFQIEKRSQQLARSQADDPSWDSCLWITVEDWMMYREKLIQSNFGAAYNTNFQLPYTGYVVDATKNQDGTYTLFHNNTLSYYAIGTATSIVYPSQRLKLVLFTYNHNAPIHWYINVEHGVYSATGTMVVMLDKRYVEVFLYIDCVDNKYRGRMSIPSAVLTIKEVQKLMYEVEHANDVLTISVKELNEF